jgi:hypothetical protein
LNSRTGAWNIRRRIYNYFIRHLSDWAVAEDLAREEREPSVILFRRVSRTTRGRDCPRRVLRPGLGQDRLILLRSTLFSFQKKAPAEPEEPIRSELFGPERLEQHARSLAAADRVVIGRRGARIVPRLEENSRVLLAAYRSIASALDEKRAITPAAEWIVDNFHIVDEQIREIRDDLNPGFYRVLPKLVAS